LKKNGAYDKIMMYYFVAAGCGYAETGG